MEPAGTTIDLDRADLLVVRLVHLQRLPVLGRFVRELLILMGTDLPVSALRPGTGLKLLHGGKVVVHPDVEIGRDVTLLQHVTLGRGDFWRAASPGFAVRIEDGAILCAGAVVLSSREPVVVGAGTIVGANSVLTTSTGPNEIWVGAPARRIGMRSDRPVPADRST